VDLCVKLGLEKGQERLVWEMSYECSCPHITPLQRKVLTRLTGLESGRGDRNGWSAWLVGFVCLTVVRVALTAPGVPVRSRCGCRTPQ